MESFSIRPATVQDATGVANVKYRGWQDTYRGIINDKYLNAMSVKELTATWQKILSPANTRNFTDVLIGSNEDVIGFVSYTKTRNNDLNTEGEIMALYLLKEYQGKGLGTQLFNHGIAQLLAKGVQSFHLNVLTKNPTLQFYRKFKPQQEFPTKVKIDGIEYDELTLIWS